MTQITSRLLAKLGLAVLLAVAVSLPLTGLSYADDPLIVNSTGDAGDASPGNGACNTGSGNCTLRAAIEESNAATGITHTIAFSIAGAGPHTLTPASALPDVTRPVIIDGLTQPGASCDSPMIEIDGTSVPAQVPAIPTSPSDLTPPIGLNLSAGNSTVRGLSIYNFDKLANTGSPFNIDIDDVGVGISVDNSNNNTIECNFLGVAADGTTAAPNQVGISIGNGSGNVITGNLISGNGNGGSQTAGVIIAVEPVNGGESSGNQILNNRIGTDKTGLLDRGNQQDGLLLVNARNTVISGNLIAGNGDDGVDITDVAQISFQGFNFSVACDSPPCATGNVIRHNTIGLDAAGNALGNGNSGIEIKNAEQNRVYSNTIAHNAYQGVEINELTPAADICTKGSDPCTLGNTVSANSIYSNTGLGIDLTANSSGGVTTNDSDDSDSGANMLQNYPVLSEVLTNATSVYISGTLTSTVTSSFTLEFFANSSCDASGFGEGRTFIISETVTTNSSGQAGFSLTTDRPTGTFFTATATDSGGNTSEFSKCVAVSGSIPVPPAPASVAITKTVTLPGATADPGDAITYTVVVANSGGTNAAGVVVTDTLPSTVDGVDLAATVTITAGQAVTFTIAATVDAAAGWDIPITNTAGISFAGGISTSSVAFRTTADTSPPVFGSSPLITPTGGISLTNKRPAFVWAAATDSQSGVVSYTLLITGSNGPISLQQASATVTTTQSAFTPTVDLATGSYTWTVRAHDASGNTSNYVSPATFEITGGDTGFSVYLPIVVKDN